MAIVNMSAKSNQRSTHLAIVDLHEHVVPALKRMRVGLGVRPATLHRQNNPTAHRLAAAMWGPWKARTAQQQQPCNWFQVL